MRKSGVIAFLFLGLLAGCATSHPPALAGTESGYVGQVVAVRQVSEGPLTAQITRILGQADNAPPVVGQEVVVKLADGDVKSFVPPQGALPAGLTPGETVVVTETPRLQISIR